MKKVLMIFAIIIAIAGIAGTAYFYTQYDKVSGEREILVQQNAALQSSIDAIGPTTTAYTVAAAVTDKDIVAAEDFVPILMPTANITEDTVVNIDSIVGKLYKVDIQPGTVITSSLIVDKIHEEPVYEADLYFSYLPLGLKVGDYVNVTLVLPYGQKFIVTNHVRVEQIVLEANVIKVWFTAAQQELWNSAMKDLDIYGSKGLTVHLEKYVEPALHEDVVPFYPVRSEMEAVINANPNIPDARLCINSRLRKQIDDMLSVISEEEGNVLYNGSNKESSAINSAASSYVELQSTYSTVNSELSESTTDLNEITDSMEIESSPNVTVGERDEAAGGSLFGDDVVLE